MSAYSSYATTTGDFFNHQNSINQTQQHQLPTQDPMIFHPAPTYYANTQDLIGYPPPNHSDHHTSTAFHYYQPIAPSPWPDAHFDVNYVNHSFDYAGIGANGLKNWSTADAFPSAPLLTTTNPTEMLMNFPSIPTTTENSNSTTILGQALERRDTVNIFGQQENKSNHQSNNHLNQNRQHQSTSPSNIPISTALTSLSANSQITSKRDEKQQLNRQQRTLNARQLQIQNPTAKIFTCTQCNRTYCRKSTLKAHMKQHTGAERQFVCECCGKTFTQAANLTAHQRVHTGEKPFACSICLRPFSQSSSLVTHRRTHTGERPYPCPHCVKSFTDSSTLTKHMRTHTGHKPYSCHLCSMRFSQSGNLHRHMKTHRGYTDEN